jgi:hypothetical protein
MIGQTIAIFIDAYRELNSRKLFWLTLILSVLIVGAFATLGADQRGISIAGLHHDFPEAMFVYNKIFQYVVISLWLTWAATVMALVSTAGIFPEFIAGGSIDLFLARPIGRARLFLTKYLSGLIFVTAQVVIVVGGSYLAMGLRSHQWQPRLFLAVPIVLCFFSYLYSVCVLVGVKTRSTIAAILVTVVFWTFCALLDIAEPSVLSFKNFFEYQHDQQAREVVYSEANFRRAQTQPILAPMIPVFARNAETARQEEQTSQQWAMWIGHVHRALYFVKTITPKTTDTIELLEWKLIDPKEEREFRRQRERERPGPLGSLERRRAMMMADDKAKDELQARSIGWVIGTSLGFEAVVVGVAMWIFCRRDY